MTCPSWCQHDQADTDPVSGEVWRTHTAVLSQHGPLGLEIMQLDVDDAPVTELVLRRRGDGSVSLPLDPPLLRVVGEWLREAASLFADTSTT